MKFLSVVSPCYNEQDNIEELYRRVKAVMDSLDGYTYEHIIIDNASTDNTVKILKGLAEQDKNLKVIVNSRNFGHIRSPYHGLMQASGEAVIYLASDLQDPPEKIPEFIKKWEEGYKIVLAVKTESEESPLMFILRKMYYDFIDKISGSEIGMVKNSTGFGLYDKKILDIVREVKDPYPYFRGLICEIGFEKAIIEFAQPSRKRGITKNNFYTLYDIAMLGITSHTKVPLRLATIGGFLLAAASLGVALGYLIAKLIFWQYFSMGTAPLLIGIFFFGSVQLFFTGLIGEYIAATHTQVLNRPVVVEKERINF